MPKVGKTTSVTKIDHQRGVRLGDNIYYSENYMDTHAQIAIDNGADEFSDENKPRPLVEDAGILYVLADGRVEMGEGSTSTLIKEGKGVRNETNEILARISKEHS